MDAALLWPTYPMLGIDDRNAYDMIRSLPGGIDALRAVVLTLTPTPTLTLTLNLTLTLTLTLTLPLSLTLALALALARTRCGSYTRRACVCSGR